MRIVHVVNTLTATFVADLLSAFPKTDAITVISLLGSGRSKHSLESAGITVVELNALPTYRQSDALRGVKLAWHVPRLVNRLRTELGAQNPEVLHTHLWFSDIIGSFAASKISVRHIVTQHDTQKLPFVVRLLKTKLLKRAAAIVAISSSVAEFTASYFAVPKEKIFTIYNGLVTEKFQSAIRTDAEWLPTLGIISRLEPVKGHRYLFAALARLKARGLKPARVYVVGTGSLHKNLVSLAAHLGIADIVEFSGYHESHKALRDIDVLIQPSLSEGLGVTVLEGLASKKLVIASRVGGIPEIITHRETGLLVSPGSSDELAAQLEEVLKKPDAMCAIRARGYNWFLEHQSTFDIIHTARAYRTLYTKYVDHE